MEAMMSQKGHEVGGWKIGRLEWGDKVKNRRYIFSLEIGSYKKKVQSTKINRVFDKNSVSVV